MAPTPSIATAPPPAAARPAPAPPAPSGNAGSGYVQIPTANGPAYFQQTPSGLMAVNDQAVVSKLRSGAIPSTVQTYSPTQQFATPSPRVTVGAPTTTGGTVSAATPVAASAPASTVRPTSPAGQLGSQSTAGNPVPTSASRPLGLPNTAAAAAAAPSLCTTCLANNATRAANATGHIVLGATMAAGEELLRTMAPYPYSALPYVTNLTEFLANAPSIQSGGLPALANYFAPQALQWGATRIAPLVVSGAGSLGPQMAIAGVAVGSYKFGEYVVAPFVAPTIGGWMYDAAPDLFTPRPTSR
jgi:hypothetical protein